MTKTNAADLAAKVDSLTADLAAIDDERKTESLWVEEGVPGAERRLSEMDTQRRKLVAAIEQARLAQGAALRREETEVRSEAARREVERQARARTTIENLASKAALLDAATLAARDALAEFREACDAVRAQCPELSTLINGVDSGVVIATTTVLSGSGFKFGRSLFFTADAQGRPDAAEQAIAPKVPLQPLLKIAGVGNDPAEPTATAPVGEEAAPARPLSGFAA